MKPEATRGFGGLYVRSTSRRGVTACVWHKREGLPSDRRSLPLHEVANVRPEATTWRCGVDVGGSGTVIQVHISIFPASTVLEMKTSRPDSETGSPRDVADREGAPSKKITDILDSSEVFRPGIYQVLRSG